MKRKNKNIPGYAHNAGSKNSTAKLREVQAIEIIQRNIKGETIAGLAHEFKLNASTVSRLVNGLTWKHIQPKRIREMRK